MSQIVTIPELRQQLPDLLRRTVESDEECVIREDGQDYAVLVSARRWRERGALVTEADATSGHRRRQTVRTRLDALGPDFRVAPEAQRRVEALLERQQTGALTDADSQELATLLEESESVMLRRAEALSEIA